MGQRLAQAREWVAARARVMVVEAVAVLGTLAAVGASAQVAGVEGQAAQAVVEVLAWVRDEPEVG